MSLEDLYEDLVVNKELPEEDKLAWELDELFTFRYGLSGEEVKGLDAKYLPSIYELIKKNYPNLLPFFLRGVKTLGVGPSIFQETSV